MPWVWSTTVLLFSSLLNLNVSQARADVLSGWTGNGGMCYKAFSKKLSWKSSLDTCNQDGAQLATVFDYNTNEFISSLAEDVFAKDFWIGLSGQTAANISEWSDGSDWSIFQGFWANGQPSTKSGNCVYVTNSNQVSAWSFGSCEHKRAFVCQYPGCDGDNSYFRCLSGERLASSRACDGQIDCTDGSDEIDCPNDIYTNYVKGINGIIDFSNLPNPPEANKDCKWTIEGPLGSVIELEFVEYNVGDGYEIIVMGGAKTELSSWTLLRLSEVNGNSLFKLTSPNNLMIVRSISNGNRRSKNFSAKWRAVQSSSPDEGVILEAQTFFQTLSQEFYPDYYLSGQENVYIIRSNKERDIIQLQLEELELLDGDYVRVRDGSNAAASLIGEFRAGSTQPQHIFSTGPVMYLLFKTRNQVMNNKKGFLFSYKTGCDVDIVSATGQIASPGYPNVNYANFQTCQWTISSSSGNSFTLHFSDDIFNIDPSDTLKIYDAVNSQSKNPTLLRTISGLQMPQDVQIQSGKATISFTTSALDNSRGFMAEFSVGCPDPLFNEDTNVTPQVSSFPYRTRLMISCPRGYVFSSEEFYDRNNRSYAIIQMQCLFGGSWNVINTPQCIAKYCGLPSEIDNGYIVSSNGTQFTSVVTYACLRGFELTGSADVFCDENGNWGLTPTCAVTLCPAIPVYPQRVIPSQSSDRIIELRCSAGYIIDGSPNLYCQDNGTWDYLPPTCSALLCRVPEIDNAIIVGGAVTVRTKQSVFVRCNEGYVINGTQTPTTFITCSAQDQTFGTPPQCEVSGFDYCSSSPCSVNETCVNEIGGFTCECKPGYQKEQVLCLDIDECSEDADLCGQICENTEAGYQCSCEPGYSLYTSNGTNNFFIPAGETGLRQGDLYQFDHTCVLNLCTSPGNVQNGYISNPKSDYYVGSTLNIGCDLGFVPKDGIISAMCNDLSIWTPSIPSCEVAKCPPDVLPTGLVNKPKKIIANDPILFGDVVTLVCEVDGQPSFNKTRSCDYNPATLEYELQGDNFECGVIDCGRPETFLPLGAIAVFPTGRSTTFGSSFVLECQSAYFLRGGSGSGLVTCQANGQWDFGTLECIYGICPDPGSPPGGQAVVDGYGIGDTTSFRCNRGGFEPVPDDPLTCVKDEKAERLIWNGTLPSCVDVEKPFILGCQADVKSVRRYDEADIVQPIALDNSGSVEKVVVNPEYFLRYQPVPQDMMVTYTAYDHEGLTETCSQRIQVIDETPPTLQCPPPVIIYLERTERINYFFNDSSIVANDNIGISIKTFSYSNLTVGVQDIGKAFSIKATAFDAAGNNASCFFQLYVSEEKCSEYSINTPLNAKKTCNATNTGGIRCEFTCLDGFYFYEDYPNDVFESTCDPGQGFEPPYVPSCSETAPVSSATRVILNYVADSGEDLFENCTDLVKGQVESIVSGLSTSLTILCLNQQDIFTVQLKADSIVSNYIEFFKRATIIFQIEMLPSGLDKSKYIECSSAIESEISKIPQDTGIFAPLRNLSLPSCPNAVVNFQTSSEQFQCEDTKLKTINGETVCLFCPPGTSRLPDGSCELCPLGTYWVSSPNSFYLSQCTLCPPGLSTESIGSTGPEFCTASCLGNFISATGVPPCEECTNNTYRYNNTHCQACPVDTKALRTENPLYDNCTATCTYNRIPSTEMLSERRASYAVSVDECKETCEKWERLNQGSQCVGFNYRVGAGVCIIYDRVGNLAINSAFDYYDRECVDDNLEVCYCAPQCPFGFYSESGFQPNCKPCPAGYTSTLGSVLCTECASNEISEPTVAPGVCFDAASARCQPGICQNGGVCRVENHDFYCECQTSFTGRLCEQILRSCTSLPCYNNGNCIDIPGGDFDCQCPSGINGSRCENNIDDCYDNACNGRGTCIDGLNSFTCLCIDGFTGNRCQTRENLACDRIACDPLGTLSCDPINDVYALCSCKDGYEGPTCATDIDSCQSSPCKNGGTCIDQVNTFICECLDGFQGDTCETPLYSCNDVNCENAVSCEEDYRTGNAMCVCNDGYNQVSSTGDDCSYNFKMGYIDGDLLEEFNSSVRFCQFFCNFQDNCVGMSHQAIPALAFIDSGICKFYSRIDRIVSNPPTDVIASEKSCNYYTDDTFVTFWLKTDYFANGFDVALKDVDTQFREVVCKGTQPINAQCRIPGSNQTLPESESVSCGTSGVSCTPKANFTCSDVEVQFECARSRVYIGETCRLKDICDELNPCLRGTCVNDESEVELYHCECPPGYEGVHCQHDINECLTATSDQACQNNAKCIDELLGFSCRCADGFTGTRCENNIDDCLSADCSLDGTQECIDGINSYTCSCKPGYTSENCSVNIDDCLTQPCYHGGTCQDRVNGYLCTCMPGWTGSQCETLVNKCLDDPCQNGATCSALFNDYHCQCPQKTYGKQCEYVEDICSNANPCYNGGSCADNGQTCTCLQGYQNEGCYISDFLGCSDITCENGGTCFSNITTPAKCNCPEEFTGSRCESHVDHCAVIPCNPPADCIDGINEAFCRCPIGRTGPACAQNIDNDFDVCLRASASPTGVGLPFPAPYGDTDGFTLMFWVKFSQPGSKGHILIMNYSSSGYFDDNSIPILSLNDAGLDLDGGLTIPFRYKPVNDGNWHYVIVTWEKSTGHVDLVLDFVRSGQLDGHAQGAIFTKGGMEVTIGVKKGSQTQQRNPVYFRGCASQLEILSRAIDFNNETEFSAINMIQGDIVRWGEFSPYGNAYVVRPSMARIYDCRGNGGIGPNCDTPRDLTGPKILACPDDVISSTIYEKAQVIWTEPSFDGAVTISSSHQPGTYFSVGVYNIIYTAKDEEGNTAICDFKVFVNSDDCSALEPPRGGGTQECYNNPFIDEPFSSCIIECAMPNSTLVEDTPSVYSCGSSGRWESLANSAELYPTCGKIVSEALKSITVDLRYTINFVDCSSITAALKNREILDDLAKFHQTWGPSVCSNSDCGDVAVSVNCDNLPDTFVQFNLSNVNPFLRSGSKSYPAEDALASEIYDNNLFDVSDIFVSSNLDRREFKSLVILKCDENEVLIGDECVLCGPGTYFVPDQMECVNCARGTYQDQYGQTSCTSCAVGQTTERIGSDKASLCEASCQAGQYFSIPDGACKQCGIGFYQNEIGQFECKPCPIGQVTGQEGSVSDISCADGCDNGEQLLPTGICELCPVGTYRELGVNTVCTPCPEKYTTPTVGSVNGLNCSILKCPPGSKADAGNAACQLCERGQYQLLINQKQCLPCPDNFTTENKGSLNASSCVRYCPSGQEFDGSDCVECYIGFYKSNADGLLGKCQPCNIGYLTRQTGSTKSADCDLRNCTAGFKIVPSVGNSEICSPCPYGEYQPEPLNSYCIKCPKQTYTRIEGATSRGDCEAYCDAGFDFDANKTCQPCAIGFYKSNDKDKFSSCQICPLATFITISTASTSEDDCNIANCSAGSFRHTFNLCVPCQVGYYQPLKWQTECIPCQKDYTTASTGSESPLDCFLQCPIGKEVVNGTCGDCPIGFYKETAGIQVCSECPTDFITDQVGASSQTDCDIRACSPGNYRSASLNQCFSCSYGQYQPLRWQDACLSCPDGLTTFRIGVQSENECYADCPEGSEYSFFTSTCEQCPVGTYRDKSDPSEASCALCPVDFITQTEGSTNISDCTIRNCSTPGEFRNPQTNLCEVCGIGTYNNIRWRESCTSCPPGFTTKELGRQSMDDCFRDCPSGQTVNENTNTCEDCGLGFFRNRAQSWTCQACPQDLTTSNTQAVTEADCSVSSCLQGQFYNATSLQCEGCPINTYQPEPNQLTCLQCPDFLLTLQMGASAVSDCLTNCAAGIHNCPQDSTCQDIAGGNIECVCNENFAHTGDNCTHVCDLSEPYCQNRGTCSKTTSSVCTCQEPYSGLTCQTVIAANLGEDDDKPVIIGTSIGGFIFILILVLFLIFFIKRMRHKSSAKGQKHIGEGSSYSESLSNLHSSSFIKRANTLGHPAFYGNYSNASIDPSVYIPGSRKGGPEANAQQATFFYDNNSFVNT